MTSVVLGPINYVEQNPKKLTTSWLVKKFSTFHGTLGLITVCLEPMFLLYKINMHFILNLFGNNSNKNYIYKN
jgi:hypothetical protein